MSSMTNERVTVDEVMRLADKYACARAQSAIDQRYDTLRTAVEQLVAERDALRAALELVTVGCQHLHHALKDRHLLSDPCPVVERVNAAQKGKP